MVLGLNLVQVDFPITDGAALHLAFVVRHLDKDSEILLEVSCVGVLVARSVRERQQRRQTSIDHHAFPSLLYLQDYLTELPGADPAKDRLSSSILVPEASD